MHWLARFWGQRATNKVKEKLNEESVQKPVEKKEEDEAVYLTVKQACKHFAISHSKMRYLLSQRKVNGLDIVVRKINGLMHIRADLLRKWMKNNLVECRQYKFKRKH